MLSRYIKEDMRLKILVLNVNRLESTDNGNVQKIQLLEAVAAKDETFLIICKIANI
jgi:ABC-type uncharacterized transport system ATPase subunit